MQQKSFGERFLEILGVILGFLADLFRQGWAFISRVLNPDGKAVEGGDTSTGTAAGLGDRARQVATEAGEKAQAVVGDVKHRAADLKQQAGEGGVAGALGDRARQMAAEASEKGRAVVGDVKHRADELRHPAGQAGPGTGGVAAGETDQLSGMVDDIAPGATESPDVSGTSRFASEYSQSTTDQPATESGIPTTSREQSLAGNQHEHLGGTEESRAAAEGAAGGALTERPGESGVSRRTEEHRADAFSYTGTGTGSPASSPQGVPIAESMHETTQSTGEAPASDTDEAAVNDSIQASVSDMGTRGASPVETSEETNIARDQPRDTWERASDVQRESELSDVETDETAGEDQGPWVAESASDTDAPAASRGARAYGEESEVSGLSAETGSGFGREEEERLTTGGEIDLENDEAPATEAAEAQDVVSLDEADEEGEVAFGGEDTSLHQDTLGLRDSESGPVAAGENDDVTQRVGTGGPEEERRDSTLGKRGERGEAGDMGRDDGTMGISKDYDEAAEVQTIPAVPEDAEAGRGGATGSGPEADTGSEDATQTARSSSTRSSRRAANPPQGAVAAPGSGSCPADYPIKGNANSRIYHMPGESSYESTVPEYCFATEDTARAAGFRPRKR
jgi:hypothetical protein